MRITPDYKWQDDRMGAKLKTPDTLGKVRYPEQP